MSQSTPKTSEGIPASSEENYLNNNIGEALECATIIRLYEAMQLLLLAAQE